MIRRVVPSEIVRAIEALFGDSDSRKRIVVLDAWVRANLKLILRLAEALPPELEPDDFVTYQQSLLMIHTALEDEASRDFDSAYAYTAIKLLALPGGQDFPLAALHRLLSTCPDEVPPAALSDLAFVTDLTFRATLRLDLSMINRALANGEWKAATVLAGSVVEALLLSVLRDQHETRIDEAISELKRSQKVAAGKSLPLDPTHKFWSLFHYIEVAHQLSLIGKKAYQQSALIVDFRDLIHPAKEVRGEGCPNRATALSAVAAIEHVINDLSEGHRRVCEAGAGDQ